MKAIGFSVFRIMVGMTVLVGGYDKVMKLVLSGFRDNSLGRWFADSIHSDAVSSHVSVLLPKPLLLAFGYVVPFWELAIGIMIVFGIFRQLGAILGMALMAVFLVGGEAMHAIDYPNMIIDIIQMYVFGIAYFLLYRELQKDPADPLALDTVLARHGRP
ncbi:MAG: DoxX family membrane protein [Woeseiaceae bacterium]|nr:DoxX family membrane protein [Woeseiaceae bacterium]